MTVYYSGRSKHIHVGLIAFVPAADTCIINSHKLHLFNILKKYNLNLFFSINSDNSFLFRTVIN